MKNNSLNFNILSFFIFLLPASILSGSFILNSNILAICLFFLFEIFKEKIFKKTFFNFYAYCLIFIFIYLIINLLFSSNFNNSLDRTLGFLRFIFLVFALKYFFEKENILKLKKIILFFWTFIFILVTIDANFEYLFGFNIVGNKSYMPGRISSFLGDELKIGAYYFGFMLLTLSTIKIYYKKQFNVLSIIILIFLFTSFIIGERSNFIKVFLSCFVFSFFLFNKKNFLLFLKILFFLIILFSIIISYNKSYYDRFVLPIKTFSKEAGLKEFIKQSTYGAHYSTAIKIYLNYPFFGVGLKNFRTESGKEKYNDESLTFNKYRQTTHPHQLHLEILSELGVIGYLIFFITFLIIFIKSYKNFKNTRNLINIAGLITTFSSLLPILPSGSFFTSYTATIFWTSFALMISKLNNFEKST